MSKRVLAMALAILAIFIFVGSPFEQAAQAVVGVDDALIAILIAALAALGITFVTTGAYNSLQDYVGSLLQDYASENATTVHGLFSGVQTGTTKLGKIVVNNRFVVLLQGFAAWLKAKYSLVNNDTVRLEEQGYTIGGITAYVIPVYLYKTASGATHMAIFNLTDVDSGTTAPGVYAFYGSDGRTLYFASLVSGSRGISYYDTVNGDELGSGTTSVTGQNLGGANISPWYYGQQRLSGTITWPSGARSYTPAEIGQALTTQSDVNYNPTGIRIGTGTILLPDDDPDYSEGDGAIIDVGASWGDTYPDVTDDVIPGSFSDGKEGDATIEYTNESEAQEQVEDTPAQSISQEVDDYQVSGLPGVFPFCIPFDIYAFFECLAAEPVAPSFTWRFYIPGICDEEIEIDLAAFDSAARILRTMELLLFIVGLAFVTRDKFLRG